MMTPTGDVQFLRDTRRRLAELWLAASPEDFPRLYGSELGRVQRLLWASAALYFAPLDEAEEMLVDRAAGLASSAAAEASATGSLLAAMLYRPAHEVGLAVDWPTVQPWLVKDLLAWSVAPVPGFRHIGDGERYAKHLESLVAGIHRGALSDPANPFWGELADLLLSRLDPTPVFATDAALRTLMLLRSDLRQWRLRARGAQLDHAFSPRPPGRRPRVGIILRHVLDSSEAFATLPVFEHLDRREFDTFLYVTMLGSAAIEQYAASRAGAVRLLPPDEPRRRQMILADDLDLLFYGANIITGSRELVALAHHRLARVQVTSVANVATTGIAAIDYFLSGRAAEASPQPAEHYTERLVMMDGSPHCFSYGPAGPAMSPPVPRAALGVPSTASVVLASAANLYKLTPELLDAWARIMAAVPNAALVLFPFGPHWYERYPVEPFTRHVHATFSRRGVARERVVLMNPQPPPDRIGLRAYLAAADLYLDSFPFCGSTSLIEPLEAGLPVVTRGGDRLRSAMGGAMLGELGLEELIAGDAEDYVAIATELARDAARRTAVAARVLDGMKAGPRFLDSIGYAQRIAHAFRAMLAAPAR